MKRSIVGLALLLAVAAAPAAHAGASFGVKAGIGLTQVNAEAFDADSRTGFAGGVYGAFDLSPNIALQPELLWVRKGAKLFSTNVTIGGLTFGRVGTTFDVDYLEVPVLLRFSAPSTGPLDLRLLAGPVASMKINEQLSATGLVSYTLPSDQLKSADFGVAVGGAAAVKNGNLKLVAEARYTFGLTNVSDLPFGGDVKNGAFYGLVGLEFPLGN